MSGLVGLFGVVWATLGVAGLLLFAIVRLSEKAFAAYAGGLSSGQWGVAALVCLFMAYTEGYRGFQLRFSPRTAARIRYLRDRPDRLNSLLAPLFAMGFFRATRRRLIATWMLTIGIVILVVQIQRLDQPWRGVIDAGVVVGLSWGLVSFGSSTMRALGPGDATASHEVP